MKDIRRAWLGCFFRVRRRFFAISKLSERRSIRFDIPGQLGNGVAKAVLEYCMVGKSDVGILYSV